MHTLRSRHRLLLYSDGQGPGVSNESAFCRQPRRHVPLLFGLPSHLPRASALARVEERGDDSSLLSRFGADPSISDAARELSVVVSPWEALRCVETVQEGGRVDSVPEKRSILRFDKSAARMRAGRVEKQQLQPAGTTLWFLMYTYHIRQASERELRDPATWLARMLFASPLERGIAASNLGNQIRISPAPAALTSQKSSSRSSHMLAIRAQIADARPKLTARNDPRKSQVIHSALPRPMTGRTVSVRTADLAGRPCRLRDAFTEIALANGERCFEALVSGCRVELRVKWP